MIRRLTNREIDRYQWDHCISSAVNGNIYGYSWYLDIVCPQWDALVENDYERVFPLPFRRKMGIRYLYQPYFVQQLGVYSRSLLTEAVVDQFLFSIPAEYKLIEINLNALNKTSASGFFSKRFLNHELDMNPGYEEIKKQYSQNLRRNLKKATEAGLVLSEDADPAYLVHIFREHRGRSLETFKPNDYRTLLRILDACRKRKLLNVTGVSGSTGDLYGGAVFVTSHSKIIFLFSAANTEARENAAMPFLIDSMIQKYAGTALTLDFEGSNDPDLARFYKSFGAREIHYLHLQRNSLPVFVNTILPLFRKFRRLIAGSFPFK